MTMWNRHRLAGRNRQPFDRHDLRARRVFRCRPDQGGSPGGGRKDSLADWQGQWIGLVLWTMHDDRHPPPGGAIRTVSAIVKAGLSQKRAGHMQRHQTRAGKAPQIANTAMIDSTCAQQFGRIVAISPNTGRGFRADKRRSTDQLPRSSPR